MPFGLGNFLFENNTDDEDEPERDTPNGFESRELRERQERARQRAQRRRERMEELQQEMPTPNFDEEQEDTIDTETIETEWVNTGGRNITYDSTHYKYGEEKNEYEKQKDELEL